MSRSISQSEVTTALTCLARWDFGYGGRLAGDALEPRAIAHRLSEGKAWGAAVAAWHAGGDSRHVAMWRAAGALQDALEADAATQRAAGVELDPDHLFETAERLGAILGHYTATAEPLGNLTRLEGHFDEPAPARTDTGRSSSRYRYQGYIDGYTVDPDGRPWLVEFKLRTSLDPIEMLERQIQYAWYAWAYERRTGTRPVGIIIDQRLNEEPKAARLVQAKSFKRDGRMVASHAKDQVTTLEAYRETCEATGEEPRLDTELALAGRVWQKRVPIIFRPDELQRAGEEIASSARLIHLLDNGTIQPVRNASTMTCLFCRFKAICATPHAPEVDLLFTRKPPKRLRGDDQDVPPQEAPPEVDASTAVA